MMMTRHIFAATLSLSLVAGCATTTANQAVPGSISKPGGTTTTTGSGANANGNASVTLQPGGSDVANVGNANPIQPANTATTASSTSTATVKASDPNATTQAAPAQAADAASEEDEVEAYNAVAEADEVAGAKSYSLEAVGAAATAKAKLTKLKAAVKVTVAAAKLKALRTRLQKLRDRNLKRLRTNEKNAVQRALKKAKWVDNGDGTETKTFMVDVQRSANGATWSRHMEITRTVEIDTHDLVAGSTDITENFAPGGNHVLHWEKARQDDGSYAVAFNQSRRYGAPGTGPTRTADWKKAIDVDGNVSGTGTITWTNKKGEVTFTETITFGGTDDRQTIANGGDTGTPETAPAQDGEATTPDAPAGTSVDEDATGAADVGATADASASADANASAAG